MEKRSAEDYDGVRLETLACAYVEVRKEMWGVLANRVGEKWGVVEQKVGSLLHSASLVVLWEAV